ncbi:MAG: hypothetical protein KIH00_07920 [Lachnospiraceae bacterium]|nr:hypothetical protein [Lachnospiraceae bacterium]
MSFVVFLDVDGVLNTRTTCERAPSEMYKGIDEARIKILANARYLMPTLTTVKVCIASSSD